MLIDQLRTSFLPEPETEATLWQRFTYLDPDKGRRFTGKYTQPAMIAEDLARLAFSSELIDGPHLWRERSLPGPSFLFSDALQDAIRTAKPKVPPMFKVKEA